MLDYLEKRLLAGSSSASSSAQQHMARLQEESRVSLEVLRKAIASLGNRDAKDKDKADLPQELLWCRQQLGDTNVRGCSSEQWHLGLCSTEACSTELVFVSSSGAA